MRPHRPRWARHQVLGFTLVELMIVVVVIAILVAIGYPTYLDQVRKARRSDATTALMQVAQRLERCYTDSNKFDASGCPSGSIDSPEGYYSVAIAATASTYTLTATPKAGTTQAGDSTCASFTLDQTGTRGAKDSGGNDTTSTCWQN